MTGADVTVVKPGWFTTVQDAGRHGFQAYGVSVSGPMDRLAYILANRLVDNRDGEAALEITLKGPELLFEREMVFAVTGADLAPELDGRSVPQWTSVLARAGSRLRFGVRRSGARSYLALAGGVDVPLVWGSRSTHVMSRIGGMKGRALVAGDRLAVGVVAPNARAMPERRVPENLRPIYRSPAPLRVLPGPHLSAFEPQALRVLTGGTYRLSSRSDRMGARLMGPRLVHAKPTQWISDGTAMGALQVPADEQPILLLADRQTTGGYPQLAVVISADWPLAGQLAPGDAVQFTVTTPGDARAALLAQRNEVDRALPARA